MPTDDAIAEIMAGSISALRSAGYLIIPPLNTPEGEVAVGRALDAWSGTIDWRRVSGAALRRGRLVNDMRAALRAAGGSDD